MKFRITPLQVVVHVGGWFPLAQLVFLYITHRMSINPIQEIEQRTGLAAVLFLVLSLVCTPLNTLFGWREAIKRRRALGLYAFLYTCLHVGIFVALDYGFNWAVIADLIVNKLYLVVGALAFLLLIPLALTSFKSSMKKLGMNWIRLHRVVYLIAPLVVLHYAWSKKGDLFHLRGDILKPFYYGLIVIILLGLRLPFVRRGASLVRTRLQAAVRRIFSKSTRPPQKKPGPPEESAHQL
jgi:sulfoxide reductase heme-binding subunit YedZ